MEQTEQELERDGAVPPKFSSQKVLSLYDLKPLAPLGAIVRKFKYLSIASLIIFTISAFIIVVGLLFSFYLLTYIMLPIYLLAMVAYIGFSHFEEKKREEFYELARDIIRFSSEPTQN